MNQSFPCRYGPIYHGTNFFYFLEKYLKKLFMLPALPSNEKNSSDHHNSYNKGPNLAFFSFTESPSNSLLTIKFPKNHITSSYHRNLPKTTKAIFGHQRALGVKRADPTLVLECYVQCHIVLTYNSPFWSQLFFFLS
jgi:hypothetical protein